MAADMANRQDALQTRCCIAGGGPAGMMLGYLLARGGVDVVVLEKHADFLRDFRGDTIHPSTMEALHELGLLDEFLKRPHEKASVFRMWVGGREVTLADFSHLPLRCPYIAFMPQWEFLNFLASQGRPLPGFRLVMQAEVTDLVEENGRIVGVRAKTPQGELDVRADLTVGADGRHSVVRKRSGLVVDDIGAPMDVLWMRLSRRPEDPHAVLGRFDRGRGLIMIDRGDYWQCGFVIRKGGIDELRARGLDAFHNDLREIAPFVGERVTELASWDQIKLLTVVVDRLRTWHRPGLLCIGDAAHAMSPVGGVGINLAIQDAIATANLLAAALRDRRVTEHDLGAVQRRRMFAARVTQRVQVTIHRQFLSRMLGSSQPASLPWFMKLVVNVPFLRRLPARLIGVGVRPEHVRPELRSGPGG